MFNTNKLILLLVILAMSIIYVSCKDKNKPDETIKGKAYFTFNHFMNGQAILFDTLIYKNAAGNDILFSEIQYFISAVNIFKNGISLPIEIESSHYVDTDIESSWRWDLKEEFDLGQYDSISFTFGFKDTDNISNMFVNPPESQMFWPEPLGGGYHYMKLNGKWKNSDGNLEAFNFHLGRGQDTINSQFIDNSFTVNLPFSNFVVTAGKTLHFSLTMEVENWFQKPNIYNFDSIGGQIMQNQEAMNMIKENGNNVFSIDIQETK